MCVSFGRFVALEGAMSHTLWWPCPRGRPLPPLLSEGRGQREGMWLDVTPIHLDVITANILLNLESM